MKDDISEMLTINLSSLTSAEIVGLCQRMLSLTIKTQTKLDKTHKHLAKQLAAQRTELGNLTKRVETLEGQQHDI